MNKLIVFVGFIILSLTCNLHETKSESYVIDYPVYDSVGNVTYYRKTIDHIPTALDTFEYRRELDSVLSKE